MSTRQNLNEMTKFKTLLESAESGAEIVKEDVDVAEHAKIAQILDVLEEFRETTMEALQQAERALRGTQFYDAAKPYWINHIYSSLGHYDLPTHGTTVERTIGAIKEELSDTPLEEEKVHCPSCLGEAGHVECPSCFGTGYYA